MALLDEVSSGYVALALVWSLYQGLRGIVETRLYNQEKNWGRWQKILVLDIHDFAFRFICTAAGFVALYVCYSVALAIDLTSEIPTGDATLLIASFIVAVIGIGGQLHYVVLLGKLPSSRA
jgi:hypothetical protein